MKQLYAILLLILALSFSSCSENIDEPEKRTNNVDVLLTGSSTIFFWDNFDVNFPMFSCLNTGYPGATAGYMVNNFDNMFIAVNPTYIVIYVGENDAIWSPYSVFVNEIDLLYSLILTKYSKANIIVISAKASPHRLDNLRELKRNNSYLKNKCEQNSRMYYVDFFAHLFVDKNVDKCLDFSFFKEDNIHINDKGYKLLGYLISEQINYIEKNEKYYQ